MISIEHETHNSFVLVRPAFNRLDSLIAPEFRSHIIEFAQDQDKLVVLDMLNVNFVDSSGLGAVVGCHKATQKSGGIALCNISEDVKEVFTLTHMDRVFDIHDDFDAFQQKQAA